MLTAPVQTPGAVGRGRHGLGGFQGPGGERIPPNPDAAKHHIDLLDVLEQKTKGNLTDEEATGSGCR